MARGYSDKIQENKEITEKIKKEQTREVINIIGNFMIDKQKDLTTATIFLDFLKKVENGEVKNILIDDFTIFTKFNVVGDTYHEVINKAINNFCTFFQRITTSKAKKPLAVKRYELFLNSIEQLKEAFSIKDNIPSHFTPAGRENEPYVYSGNFMPDKSNVITELNKAFYDLEHKGNEYFQFAKELKNNFEAFSNNQKAKDEFKKEMLRLIEIYEIDAYDFFNKATFANAIVKFYYPKEAD